VTTSVTTVTLDEESTGILSSHERSIIRKTWDQAKKDGDVAPQVLYRYVFQTNCKINLSKASLNYNIKFAFSFIKAHPEYQKKFSKFADVPQSELLSNGNFLAQAYTILAGLNVVIQSLSSQELLANQLNALGGAHQPRGVTPAMFEVSFLTKKLKAQRLFNNNTNWVEKIKRNSVSLLNKS
jgi:hypothetical protein